MNLKNDSEFEMLYALLSHADLYPADIQLMFSHMKRLRHVHEVAAQAHASLGSVFNSFGTLGVLDEEVIGMWVERNSDLTATDLLKAKEFDSKSWWQLCAAGTQLPLAWGLPTALQNIVICVRFFDSRYAQTGKRLADIKAKGGFNPSTGKINFQLITYQLEWASQRLTGITHVVSGVRAALPAGHGLNDKYSFSNWWCDQEALAELPPMKPTKILTFLGGRTNVFGYDFATNKKKDNPLLRHIESLEHIYVE